MKGRLVHLTLAIFMVIGVLGIVSLNPPSADAWVCTKYEFQVTLDGIVQVRNKSNQNEPSQDADVFINGTNVDTVSVPALPAHTNNWVTIGDVSSHIPEYGQYIWAVEGDKDCGNSGVNEHQVPICHATGSEANPFNSQVVDVDSILKTNGHDSHGGDVIPPFTYVDEGVQNYPGKNWDAEGPAIFDNDCQEPHDYAAELEVELSCEGVLVTAIITDDGEEISSQTLDEHAWQYPFIQEDFGPKDYEVELPDESSVTLHLEKITEPKDCVTPTPKLGVGSCMLNSEGPWKMSGTAHGATSQWRLVRYGSSDVINLGTLSDGQTFNVSTSLAGTWVKQFWNGLSWQNSGGTHVTALDQWPSQACGSVEPSMTGEADCDGYAFTVYAPGASKVEFDGPAFDSWNDPFTLESVSRNATVYWPDGSTTELSDSVDEPEECKLTHETGPWSNSDCDQYWGGYVFDGQKVESFRGNWKDTYGPESVTVDVTISIPEGELGKTEFSVTVRKDKDCIECKVTRLYYQTTYQDYDAPASYWQGPFERGPGICSVIHDPDEVPSAERVTTICSLCEDQYPGGFIYDLRDGNGDAFYGGWVEKVQCYGEEPYYRYASYRWDEWARPGEFTQDGERLCPREEGCADWIHENYPEME